MNDNLLEQLLHEGESSSLDYKRDQYPFAGVGEEDKSELLKDILAFANGWRHADAYILIGVEECPGGRSRIIGVSNHIPENDLQQFVNSKTNRLLTFSYRAFGFEGKQIGIITIPQQERPYYLKKNYGRLQKEVVYYRQGTSTAIATPDDIFRMGSTQTKVMQEASLNVEFADTRQELSIGNQIGWSAEFCQMPSSDIIPTVDNHQSQASQLIGGFSLPSISNMGLHDSRNNRYYHERANYEFCRRLFRKTRLVISNIGDVPASEVRIEMTIPTKQGIIFMQLSEYPSVPKRRKNIFDIDAMRNVRLRPVYRPAGDVNIEQNDHRFKIDIDCGNLQPGRQVWSDEFYIGIRGNGPKVMVGRLLASNLPEPQDFELTIVAEVRESQMTVEELVSLHDPVHDEEG